MWLSGVLYLFSSQLGRAGKSVSEIVKRYSRVTGVKSVSSFSLWSIYNELKVVRFHVYITEFWMCAYPSHECMKGNALDHI